MLRWKGICRLIERRGLNVNWINARCSYKYGFISSQMATVKERASTVEVLEALLKGKSFTQFPINWIIMLCHCKVEYLSTCTVLEKHHLPTGVLLGLSMITCWPLIKAWNTFNVPFKSNGLKHTVQRKIQGCILRETLSSALHTNLPSMKSDLIKIVWIKFVFKFKSLNLSLSVYGVWCEACRVDENMLILNLPYSIVKPDGLGSGAFNSEELNMLLNVVLDNECRRAM